MTTTNINIVQKLKNEIKQSVPGQNFEFEVKNETVELFGRSVEIARVHFKATDEYNVGWVVDQHAPNCMRCDAAFSYFFKLKHHCRKCGYLVCDPCSVHRLKVLNISEPGESRACTHCYNVHIAEMKAKKDASKPETSASLATESSSEKSQPVVSSEQSQENPVVPVNTVKNNSTSVTHVTSTTENSSHTTINNSKENASPQAPATSTVHVSVSSNAAPSREIVDKVQSSRQREEEEKRAKLSETKQHKLNEFLGDNVDENLSIAERDAQRTRAEQERQAKFEEEKKAKLIAFLKVEGYEHSSEFKNMSVTERAELTRLKAEEEKTAKLEQEKQAKLAAFLAQDKDGHPVEKSPEGGNRKSVSDRYENAKRIQHSNEEERMATLKRDPSRSVIQKEGSPNSAFSSPVSGRKQLNSAKSSPDVTVTVTTAPAAVEPVVVVSTTAADEDSAVVSAENQSSSDVTVSSSAAEKEEENSISTEVVAQSASESHHETHSEQHTATSHVVITQRVTTTTKSSTVVETHSHAHRSHRLTDRIHEHHAEHSANHNADHPVIDAIVSHRAEVQQEEATAQTESSTPSSEAVVLNAENHAPVSVVEVTVTVTPAEPVVEEPVSPVAAPATDDVAEGRVSTSPVEEERPSEVGGEERESVSEVKDGAVSVKTGKKNNKKGKKSKK